MSRPRAGCSSRSSQPRSASAAGAGARAGAEGSRTSGLFRPDLNEAASCVPDRGADRAARGIARSAGKYDHGRAPFAGLQARALGSRGPAHRDRDGSAGGAAGGDVGRGDVREAAGQPGDGGFRDNVGGSGMKFGIVTFPGSNCDYDAYRAVVDQLGAEATYLWHKTEDLEGVDVVVLPGGFSYGDYLRAGAIARFSPIMREVVAHAR